MLSRRPHEISRLEAFSDAAFAFALTLLVISLDVPRSYGDLMRLMAGLPSFACCFSLLVWIWHEHNLFFRRYGLQDGYTVFLNGALLFVVLFYVYPLKFMFDSMFAMIPALRPPDLQQMTFAQLQRASTVYASGFVALFAMFALLYHRAYVKRRALDLDALGVFDVKMFAGHHLVSAGVGVLALLVAAAVPAGLSFLSPSCFVLMGPAHTVFGYACGRRRRMLAAQLSAAL